MKLVKNEISNLEPALEMIGKTLRLFENSYSNLSNTQKQHLKNHFIQINYRNSILALIILVILNSVVESLFLINMLDSQATNLFKQLIRIVFTVVALSILGLAYLLKGKNKSLIAGATIALLLIYALVFTLESQYNHARLTVYITAIIAFPMYFRLKKNVFVTILLSVHIVFIICLALIQNNQSLLITDSINASAVAFLSMLLGLHHFESEKKL